MGQGIGFYVLDDIRRTKKRRDKRTPFDKNLRYYKDEGKKKIFPKLTEIQLSAIRERMKKQNRKERDKSIIAFIIAIPITIGLIVGFFKYWTLF
ncbi:hypothetical protein [Kordia sp.]|uniref:hypothetical protein n=1 Tax=Kordia sp. TaxID=1965332 RepID=UPI003D6B708B